MEDEFIIQMLAGVDRKDVHWNPSITKDRCSECGLCFNFCKHDVYVQIENKYNVINPSNCVLLCNRCTEICPNGAISFPTKKDLLKEITLIRKKK